ncbi:uncharacterized protein ARMOST_16744 [Armillaria ostoyae]|uniref:Uncharacterized protein n=1 Tax=Armillaria ostoyae TaxID=47428 RepID=A0A284RX20_ARMOS|nr:uncharacterized protein ARMOST_16744 [Armillaria ostoyae]
MQGSIELHGLHAIRIISDPSILLDNDFCATTTYRRPASKVTALAESEELCCSGGCTGMCVEMIGPVRLL